MPPTSGMQATAAATFEGRPVDTGCPPVSGPGPGGGGCWVGSVGSGIFYIHELGNILSSNSAIGRIRPQANLRHNFALVSQLKRILSRFNRERLMTKNHSRGFTLIELLVVIAIIITIGYPALIGALERAKVTKDMNNLHQIGIATQLYMNDNDGTIPGSTTATWMSQLNPKYVSVWRVFQSPFDTRGSSELGNATTPVSYGI